MTNEITDTENELRASQSTKRRSAAKRLRKLCSVSACPSLQEALLNELKDPRTWETQYQMVMAIGHSNCQGSLALLRQTASQKFEATMVYLALGDAIFRLSSKTSSDAAPAIQFIRQKAHPILIDGALRAIAMLRIVPDQASIDEILAYAIALAPEDGLKFWVAAAAPGWTSAHLDHFLKGCEGSSRTDLKEASALARARKYKKWNPL